MRRGLAIETAGRFGSVALVQGEAVVAEEQFAHGLKHAAEILPRIDRLCRLRGWRAGDLGEVYVSVGPGSFTGLRIGITLAKTLAFATGAAVAAVSTMRVLSGNAPAEARHLVIVLDAKRDQIYTARFERPARPGARPIAEDWIEREPPHVDDLPAMLARSPRPVHLLGEGLPYHQKFIPPTDPSILVAPEPLWPARASVVAAEGIRMADAEQFTPPDLLLPLYLRRPEAEEKFQERLSKP